MVFALPIDTSSEKRRAVNPRKFYVVDPALAWAAKFDADVGHRLEAAVYLELRRRGLSVAYHVDEGGHEIDFVARHSDGRVDWIQVASSLADPDTRARELRAFESIPRGRQHHACVVTRLEEARLTIQRRTIEVVPAWKWLLGLTEPAAPSRRRPASSKRRAR